MADRDVDIELKIKSDTRGAEKAQGALSRLGSSVASVRSAVGKLMGALGLLGLAVNGINHLIDAFKAITKHAQSADNSIRSLLKRVVIDPFIDRLKDANEEADKFANTLEIVAKNAGLMSEKLSRAAIEAKVTDQNNAQKLAEKRAFEDANLSLDEQRELSGVTDEKEEQAILDKYAAKRIDVAQSRAVEDAENARQAAKAAENQKLEEAQKWDDMRSNVERTIKQLTDEIAVAEKEGTEAQVNALKSALKAAESQSAEYAEKADKARFDARMAGITSNEQNIVERTANAQAEAARMQLETERKKREEAEQAEKLAREQKLKEEETRVEDEIAKNEGKINSIVSETGSVGALKAQDRISALGGFASVGAASLTGMGVMPRENKEINRLTNLVQSLKAELEDIQRAIKDSNSRFS